jgi:hypothetical protein
MKTGSQESRNSRKKQDSTETISWFLDLLSFALSASPRLCGGLQARDVSYTD